MQAIWKERPSFQGENEVRSEPWGYLSLAVIGIREDVQVAMPGSCQGWMMCMESKTDFPSIANVG